MLRVSRNGSPVMVIPPLALVTPVPLSIPPDQVSKPLTVNVPVPFSVPLLCSKVVMELVPLRLSPALQRHVGSEGSGSGHRQWTKSEGNWSAGIETRDGLVDRGQVSDSDRICERARNA